MGKSFRFVKGYNPEAHALKIAGSVILFPRFESDATLSHYCPPTQETEYECVKLGYLLFTNEVPIGKGSFVHNMYTPKRR